LLRTPDYDDKKAISDRADEGTIEADEVRTSCGIQDSTEYGIELELRTHDAIAESHGHRDGAA